MKFLDTYGILKSISPEYGEFTDPRDGKKYQTVILNGVEWFRENLNYNEMDKIEGADEILDLFAMEPLSLTGKDDSCGRYYSFDSAKIACPKGWEIPKRHVWIDLFTVITGKTPNEWKDLEKNMIFNAVATKNSPLNLGMCGKYEDRNQFGIWGSSSTAGDYKEILLMNDPYSGYYLTSTPGSMENGGAVFQFSKGLGTYKEIVGYGKYTVRPIRKNI
jgi:uncharacterized protein (TIGR02145 family)